MTDIQKARDMLKKWRDGSTAGPWRVSTYGHGGQFTDVVQPAESQPNYDQDRFDNMDIDVASIKESDGDARLIVGTAGNPDLLDAIDALFDVWARAASWGAREFQVDAIAAAILSADERMQQ